VSKTEPFLTKSRLMSVVVKSGYMRKQGGTFKTWQRRWFTLVDQSLVYFKDQGGARVGAIPLTDADTIAVAPLSECKHQPAFKLIDADKRFVYISPDTPEEANSWVDACRKAASGVGARLRVTWQDFATVEQFVSKENGAIELVRLTSDNSLFVWKTYRKDCVKNYAAVIESKQDMLKLIHPFVTTLVFILLPESEGPFADQVGFVYEYATHGCLFGLLWAEGKFTETRVQLYAAEIFLGLVFLHQKKVTYRDLAPDCILLMADGHIKLPEPGLAPAFTRRKEYIAPEAWTGGQASPAGDWYSFGVLVYEMITGLPPFWCDNELALRTSVLHDPLRFPRHVSKVAKDFLGKLLNRDPIARLGCGPGGSEEIKGHLFFAGLNWEDVAQRTVTPEWVPDSGDVVYRTIEQNK
jgi:serine/threonine protein kinase